MRTFLLYLIVAILWGIFASCIVTVMRDLNPWKLDLLTSLVCERVGG